MNLLEAELCYPLGQTLPAFGRRIEVAPGLFWLRMPLPFALDHINLWLLRDRFEDRDGWTVIDCGVANETIRGYWEQLIAEQFDELPIVRVLCTHTHPDHVGLAEWLTARFEAPLWMTLGEYAQGRILSAGLKGADAESVAAHFKRNGAEPDLVTALRNRDMLHFASLVPSMPSAFTRIVDGQRVEIGGRSWQVIIGLGHSPEHAALHCAADRLLISGDMVLPRISTNCSVYAIEPLSNPVRWFLDSLLRFDVCDRDGPGDAAATLVLPSHGRPFQRLNVRLRQLRDHHQDRLGVLLEACRHQPHTGASAVPVLFNGRRFDAHQMAFAVGEALAHLHALWYDDELSRQAGADGTVRFAAV